MDASVTRLTGVPSDPKAPKPGALLQVFHSLRLDLEFQRASSPSDRCPSDVWCQKTPRVSGSFENSPEIGALSHPFLFWLGDSVPNY